MKPQRKIAQRPEEYTVSLRAWVVETLLVAVLGALLGVALAVAAFYSSGARAATPQATAKLTVHDPLRGTKTLTEALDRLQYSGSLPAHWSIRTPQGTHTGTLSHLTYRGIAPGHYRADIEYTVWVPGRVYASGFEK